MLRSFIALEIPFEIQRAITDSTANLRKAFPKPIIRWVPQENVHLTLKFLGDVSPANLDLLADALKPEASQHVPFTFSVGGLGAFPDSRRLRVLWIGLEAPPALASLQRGVEAVTARLGYPAENRGFSPHLTIGRVGQDVSAAALKQIGAALETTKVGSLGETRVDAVRIYKSDLQPGGSVYSLLHSMPLAQ